MNLLSELKRRNVFRAAALYAVAAWLIMQVGEVTFEPLYFPDWAMTALVIAAIVGFPIAMVVAWFFDLDLHGFKRDTPPGLQTGEVEDAVETKSSPGGPSIAVLSFDDMSPEKDQQYLCDGIAEEILNRLAKIQNLRVASRTSSFRFKEQAVDVSDIGRQLRVSTVLEGSVRKAGDHLRITTQLINAEDGYHLWTHSYDRDLEQIFEIQDDIATQGAESLEVALQISSTEEGCTTSDVRAYD